MRVIDCFSFYNELDMLEYRLRLLSPYVDNFVLVEADHTYRGNAKPFLYEQHAARYAEFADKILHVKVAERADEDPWVNENRQRNAMQRGLDALKLAAEDLVLICDLDELPAPELMSQIRHTAKTTASANACWWIPMYMFYYNTQTMFDFPWRRAALLPYECLRTRFGGEPQKVRDAEDLPVITAHNSGWHLSYFGDAEFIKNKIQQFAHSELDLPEYTDQEAIQQRIISRQDLFDRDATICAQLPVGTQLPPQIMLSTGQLWPASTSV